MIVVGGLARLKPGQGDVMRGLFEKVAAATHAESGCISYEMYPTRDNCWFVFEEWETEEAMQRHLAAEHTQEFLRAAMPLLAVPPQLKKYQVTSSGPLF